MSSQLRPATSTPNWFMDDARLQQARARFQLQLQALPSGSARIGDSLIDKLSPPGWTLEWYLPKWLATTFELAEETTDELIVANLFGLCFVGLQDRLLDDEADSSFRHDASILSTALHHWWLERHVLVCGDDAWFWAHFSRIMAEWWGATAVSNVQPAGEFADVLRDAWQLLAHRASPLKVCCVAVTRLAHRQQLLPALEESLDHLHVAAVLLDHAQDWQEDLAAGRYNAFVHFLSPGEQVAENLAMHEQRVMEDLWFGDRATAYFEPAHAQLDLALSAAQQVHCPPFHEFIAQYHLRLNRYDRTMRQSARAILEQTTTQLFGVTY